MKTAYFEDAQHELDEATEFYHLRDPRLAQRLLDEFDQKIAEIEEYPRRSPRYHGQVRRCLLRTFPYAVFYLIYHDQIVVVAISHLSRKPLYWLDRLI